MTSGMFYGVLAGGTHSHDAAGSGYHGPGAETVGVGKAPHLRRAAVWTKRKKIKYYFLICISL